MTKQIKHLDTEQSSQELLHILNPTIRTWFSNSFADFSPPQKKAILPIHSRENTLVSAPTGSGKTLTAFLSVLNQLVDSAQKGILEERIHCVYISPLKALNNDIEKNLLKPLSEIEELSAEKLGIRVAVRTGDTTSYQRAKMLKNPPHILITTPESLAILLSSKKFSEHLRTVEWTIIDEIHSVAENKRGVHLSLSLERLQRLSPGMCRVGLSATVAPIEEVAHYLAGERPVNVIDVQYLKDYDLQVISPVEDLIDTPHYEMHNKLYRLMRDLIVDHRTTLIFTNTRSATERVVDTLKERYPDDFSDRRVAGMSEDEHGEARIGAHHGSLSKELRFQIENSLKEGKLKACVSSTSLELGIDIGYIDLVLCMSSPKSVARFLQRCGRAGHKLHETVKGRLLVMNRDDLVECAVLLKNAREKKIDRIHIPTNCLDVLAQQIMGMSLERTWGEKELYDVIRQSYCYRNLEYKDYDQLLQYLAGEFVDLEQRYIFAKIWREDGTLKARGRMTRAIYMMNVGTIPDSTHVTVKIGDQVIGRLDEGFLEKMRGGDIFVLGGSTYKFRYSRGMTLQVQGTQSRPPTVPRWISESLPLSFDLARSIGRFRRLLGEKMTLGKKRSEILEWIHEYLYVDDKAARAVYNYFEQQQKFCQVIPHDKLMYIEEHHDESGTTFIVHSMHGRRVNDCLGKALAYIISRRTRRDVEVGVNDNGFTLRGAGHIRIQEALKLLRSDKLQMVLEMAIEHTEIYKRRFRHCAERALMILKNYMGRKKSVGRSHVNAQILMHALRRIDNKFSLLQEAKREVLEDLMDIQSAIHVVKEIEDGKIKTVVKTTKLPSPFAFNIALQGHMDVLKIEDKHEFLRRMHSYVMAKIGMERTSSDTPEEMYDKLWHKQEEEKEIEVLDVQTQLRRDSEHMIQKLKLPTDYLRDLYRMIDGEKRGYRQDFIGWLDKTFTGPVPKCVSDELAKYILGQRGTIW